MEAEESRFVDHRGRPFSRSSTGGWRSAVFVIGVEMAERFAYYGIASNLITYMTGPMGSSVAAAAENVNAWSGTSMMLPLLGGLLADSWLGRYRIILVASALYLLGLGMLTVSAAIPSLHPSSCNSCKGKATPLHTFLFFLAVYLVALAQGCHKPNAQAFAADQFDESDPGECKAKSSFFNWWYWGMSLGATAAIVIVNYVEDNVSWGIGFGIPFAAMAVAVLLFLLGIRTYRYYVATAGKNPLLWIADGVGALWRRARAYCSREKMSPADGSEMEMGTNQLHSRSSNGRNSSKRLLKLLPIWATCLIYAVCFSQTMTVFTKQGSTMERTIGNGHLKVPPATLQIFISCTIILFVPLYDRMLVPLTRRLTGLHSGITTLQRIGVGQLFAIASMICAAAIEMERLKVVQDRGLSGLPKAVVPMKLWWLVPQYVLFGVADVFAMVGMQEFFYEEAPDGLRSVGLSLYLSVFGIGSFLSSILVAVIDRASKRSDGRSWFDDNLNAAHMDYFYWLLAVLCALELLLFVLFARSYRYRGKGYNDSNV